MTDIDLATVSPQVRAAYLRGYETGWMHSRDAYELSYEQQMTDLAAHYVRMIHLNEEIERNLASTVRSQPFDVMADRRGQHERAARQRHLLRERGVV